MEEYCLPEEYARSIYINLHTRSVSELLSTALTPFEITCFIQLGDLLAKDEFVHSNANITNDKKRVDLEKVISFEESKKVFIMLQELIEKGNIEEKEMKVSTCKLTEKALFMYKDIIQRKCAENVYESTIITNQKVNACNVVHDESAKSDTKIDVLPGLQRSKSILGVNLSINSVNELKLNVPKHEGEDSFPPKKKQKLSRVSLCDICDNFTDEKVFRLHLLFVHGIKSELESFPELQRNDPKNESSVLENANVEIKLAKNLTSTENCSAFNAIENNLSKNGFLEVKGNSSNKEKISLKKNDVCQKKEENSEVDQMTF